jgi:hypothetical protein
MKVINLLAGTEVEIDRIQAMYTGSLHALRDDVPHAPESFEKSVPERIMPRDLVLHELNLLQVGFTFWIKLSGAPGEGMVWVPAKMDP